MNMIAEAELDVKSNVGTSTANWNQIYSLLALNAAIVISWIAYHNYQPKVLELFNFQELSFFLVVAQALILVFIPPIAGVIGDRVIRGGGNRFVVFTVGISVTAMVFMCVAFTVGTANSINITAALPFMIVVWLISMNIFHSPANSMLEMFASAKALPSAMALMVLTTELLYALEPLIVDFVDFLGPVVTFAFGGVLLIVTGYIFRRTTRNIELRRSDEDASRSENNFMLVLAAGLALGVAVALIKNYLPEKIETLRAGLSADTISGPVVISMLLAISAVVAWPLSKIVDKIGTAKSLIYGLLGCFVCLGLSALVSNVDGLVMLAFFTAPFFSLASVAAFPFALSKLSVRNVTLGTGIFFGSIELADGVLNILDKA
jgi:MFS family permease